jgi:hypothetical protein
VLCKVQVVPDSEDEDMGGDEGGSSEDEEMEDSESDGEADGDEEVSLSKASRACLTNLHLGTCNQPVWQAGVSDRQVCRVDSCYLTSRPPCAAAAGARGGPQGGAEARLQEVQEVGRDPATGGALCHVVPRCSAPGLRPAALHRAPRPRPPFFPSCSCVLSNS